MMKSRWGVRILDRKKLGFYEKLRKQEFMYLWVWKDLGEKNLKKKAVGEKKSLCGEGTLKL